MYRKIDPPLRMTLHEASEHFPDEYILAQRDNRDSFNPMGAVLYVGSDGDELFKMQVRNEIALGIVVEGMNLQRRLDPGKIVAGEFDIIWGECPSAVQALQSNKSLIFK
jgi:hypothetical protein